MVTVQLIEPVHSEFLKNLRQLLLAALLLIQESQMLRLGQFADFLGRGVALDGDAI